MRFDTIADIDTALRPYVARAQVGYYKLDNVQALAAYLGSPQDSLRVIHIAGTSGKTTTSYYIANLLAAAGQKVGLTVSPHIVNITERAQILGAQFGESDFIERFSEYIALVEASDIEPSYFELMMVFAFWLFAREKVDYAVIETGLGGTLDASNICRNENKLCVLTDIGYDHMNVLGSTLSEIATQKAGIIASGNTVCMYRQGDDVMSVVRDAVSANHAQLELLEGKSDETFMVRNFHLAAKAYAVLADRDGLDVSTDRVLAQVMSTTHVPGRVERLRVGNTTFVLDGAHNPQKLNTLFLTLDKLHGAHRWPIIAALKADKDIEKVTNIISSHASEIVATEFSNSQDQPVKSYSAGELAAYFGDVRAVNYCAAVEYFIAKAEREVLITGSFYLVSQVRAWLIAEKQAIIEQ